MKKKKSLLWQITPQEGGPVSYLFGTMHVRDERAFHWLEPALLRMAECEYFAAEYDFGATEPALFEQTMQLPAGLSLRSLLPRGAWKRLEFQANKQLHLPAASLEFQHPMVVSTLLSTALLQESRALTLDETLYHQAVEWGKKIMGVETFAEQVELIRRIPLKVHVKGLVDTLKHPEREKKQMKRMIRLYSAGDINQLYQVAKKSLKGRRKYLLQPRNQVMANRIAPIAAQHAIFCAVGAAHLGGKKGVLALLKRAGFEVGEV